MDSIFPSLRRRDPARFRCLPWEEERGLALEAAAKRLGVPLKYTATRWLAGDRWRRIERDAPPWARISLRERWTIERAILAAGGQIPGFGGHWSAIP